MRNSVNFPHFVNMVDDLLDSDQVQSMTRLNHHGKVTCFDHSLFVAYLSFRAARFLKLDYRAAARGGLLHDLYLYNNRDKSAHPGWQCFDHPVAAWRNAKAITTLSPKEENIILSHMWPFSKYGPRSKEALLVNAVDTFCAAVELSCLYQLLGLIGKVPSSQLHPKAS